MGRWGLDRIVLIRVSQLRVVTAVCQPSRCSEKVSIARNQFSSKMSTDVDSSVEVEETSFSGSDAGLDSNGSQCSGTQLQFRFNLSRDLPTSSLTQTLGAAMVSERDPGSMELTTHVSMNRRPSLVESMIHNGAITGPKAGMPSSEIILDHMSAMEIEIMYKLHSQRRPSMHSEELSTGYPPFVQVGHCVYL